MNNVFDLFKVRKDLGEIEELIARKHVSLVGDKEEVEAFNVVQIKEDLFNSIDKIDVFLDETDSNYVMAVAYENKAKVFRLFMHLKSVEEKMKDVG
ncbi:hypothetical protein GLW05_20880 [Pontibacillus yanchengensis]|uniref:Uncharacterized protein n=1 Tax=Pontibacillus yanchengensis TaxID=462910 RepID=A0A6I5A783_9BACI|nr:hypothetical protein [Pontibacillus yanchengensis]MYL36029.1 hypothetical protein [Pontibacillus yanchengensis]